MGKTRRKVASLKDPRRSRQGKRKHCISDHVEKGESIRNFRKGKGSLKKSNVEEEVGQVMGVGDASVFEKPSRKSEKFLRGKSGQRKRSRGV